MRDEEDEDEDEDEDDDVDDDDSKPDMSYCSSGRNHSGELRRISLSEPPRGCETTSSKKKKTTYPDIDQDRRQGAPDQRRPRCG